MARAGYGLVIGQRLVGHEQGILRHAEYCDVPAGRSGWSGAAWLTSTHRGVGVAERPLRVGDEVFDVGGVGADLPQRVEAGELVEHAGLGAGQAHLGE